MARSSLSYRRVLGGVLATLVGRGSIEVEGLLPSFATTSQRSASAHLEPSNTAPQDSFWKPRRAPGRTRASRFVAASEKASAEIEDTKENSKQDEWDTLIKSLEVYKEKFGDLRVPARYIVPDEDAWPKDMWGLRLGIRVASIRSIGRYVKDEPERVEALEQLGFEWQLRTERTTKQRENSKKEEAADPGSVSFDALLGALGEYVEIHGNANVPSTFVVPDAAPWSLSCRSMPLGMCLNQMKVRGAYIETRIIKTQMALAQEKAAEKLKGGGSMSSSGSSSGEEAEELNPAALAAKEAELEKEAEAEVAKRKKKLAKLGVSLKAPSRGEAKNMSKRFERVVEALTLYKGLQGTLDVPQHFSVPEEEPWPEELWGLRLGSRVNAIRSQGTFVKNNPDRRALLSDMGFRWETEAGLRARSYEQRRAQMAKSGGWESWQQQWAGAANGDSSTNPYFNMFGEEEEEEEEPEAHTFDDVIAALQLWNKEFKQSENIPEDLAVPSAGQLNDLEMELDALSALATQADLDEAAGPLGGVKPFDEAASGLPEDDLDLFEEEMGLSTGLGLTGSSNPFGDTGLGDLGDLDDLFGDMGWKRPSEADLAKAQRVSPEEEAQRAAMAAEKLELRKRVAAMEWPKRLANLPLGAVVAQLRRGDMVGKFDPERRAKLDKVKFTWGDETKYLHVDFDKTVRGLMAYTKEQSDMCVPFDFVVPVGSHRWEEDLQGYKLGEATNLLRAQREMIEAEYPERYKLLNFMEFYWLPPVLVGGQDSRDFAERNEARVAEVTEHQRDYSDQTDWATLFYEELLSPPEWTRLKTAFEKGFVWADGPLFDLDDMIAVEEAHPEDFEEDELEAEEDYEVEFDEDDDEEPGDAEAEEEDLVVEDKDLVEREKDDLDLDDDDDDDGSLDLGDDDDDLDLNLDNGKLGELGIIDEDA